MYKLFLNLLIIILFNACGGGGESSSSTVSTNTITEETGYLVDSAVKGVEYTTNSKSGLTDVDGKFTYNSSDTTITFKIGNLVLNDFNLTNIHNDKTIYPTDLVGVDRNNTNDTNVTNMIRVLQSLDDDNNPDNGIVILDSVKNSITLHERVLELNITRLTSIIQNTGKSMKSERDALIHFEKTLRDDLSLAIDTVAPQSPILLNDINQTESETNEIEVIGEAGSKLFINGIDTNITIGENGRVTVQLDTNATLGNSNVYTITLKDEKYNQSDSYELSIIKIDNTPPVFISNNEVNVSENQTSAITVYATDLYSITYSIDGLDSAYFDINSSTGVITFINAPDYENKTLYEFTVTADDGTNQSNQDIKINIINQLEVPIIDHFNISIDENITSFSYVGTIQIVSQGDSGIESYTLSGADSDYFFISNDGNITVNRTLDYETKSLYEFNISAINSVGESELKELIIMVKDVNEAPNIISSTFTVNENNSSIGYIVATDPENNTLYYSIENGEDSDTIMIDSTTGSITFINTPDYEIPIDFDGDNIYSIIVRIADDELYTEKNISIVVKNIADTVEELATPDYTLGQPSSVITDFTDAEYNFGSKIQLNAKARNVYEQGWTGKGVRVGVIDSGLSYHSELTANIRDMYSIVDYSSDAINGLDDYGHGSGVAGVIAAEKNGAGMMGIAYESDLISMKVLNQYGSTSQLNVSKAVAEMNTHNIKVSNISIGGYYPTFNDEIKNNYLESINNDHSLIFSAGNNGKTCHMSDDNLSYVDCNFPAANVLKYPELNEGTGAWMIVGTVDKNNQIVSTSNKAGLMKNNFLVVQIGEGTTLGNFIQTTNNSNGYYYKVGTSFTTPIVVGAFSLLSHKYPNLTGAQIRDIIFTTCEDLGEPGVDDVYGHGKLNIDAAINYVAH